LQSEPVAINYLRRRIAAFQSISSLKFRVLIDRRAGLQHEWSPGLRVFPNETLPVVERERTAG
jgi:hypothetical protein